MTASSVHLTSLWQVKEGLGGGGHVLKVTGHHRMRVPLRDDGGELMSVYTGEVSLSLLCPCSHLAKQTLDFLNDFKEHSFAEKDVDPGVKNGVEGGKAYGA